MYFCRKLPKCFFIGIYDKKVLNVPKIEIVNNCWQSLLYSLHFLDYHLPEDSFTQVLPNVHKTTAAAAATDDVNDDDDDDCNRESLEKVLSCLDFLPSFIQEIQNARFGQSYNDMMMMTFRHSDI